jgi:hypothetical protein
MTTAYDLRHLTPTPHSERIEISVNDNVTPCGGSIDVICGDVALLVEHHTRLAHGLATTTIDAVHAYLSSRCLVPFSLPADLDIRLIHSIEAYFELQADLHAREDADERRAEAYLARMEDNAHHHAA